MKILNVKRADGKNNFVGELETGNIKFIFFANYSGDMVLRELRFKTDQPISAAFHGFHIVEMNTVKILFDRNFKEYHQTKV